jgi:hypothetical protein
MNLPLENLATTWASWGLIVALVLGFAFGFVLERAGFGRSTKLAAQFYLRDMTVFKVMFSAIVVAMLGLVVADGLGLADLQAIALSGASFTFLWPMVAGGLLLGVGFIISGYCPGTSIVAAASGNVDGLFTVMGVVVGSLLFGELYPWIGEWSTSSNLGHLFLPQVIGLPQAALAVAVTVMAIGAFLGADKLEQRFGLSQETPVSPARRRARRIAFSALGAGATAALAVMLLTTPAPATASARRAAPMDVETLAQRLVSAPWSVRIVDLRGEAAWSKARIPQSEPANRQQLGRLGLQYIEDGNDLIVVDQGNVDQLPAEFAGYGGRVFTLTGGFAAWETFALRPPPALTAEASETERTGYLFRAAVHGLATGQATAAPPPRPRRSVGPRRATGGGGCS